MSCPWRCENCLSHYEILATEFESWSRTRAHILSLFLLYTHPQIGTKLSQQTFRLHPSLAATIGVCTFHRHCLLWKNSCVAKASGVTVLMVFVRGLWGGEEKWEGENEWCGWGGRVKGVRVRGGAEACEVAEGAEKLVTEFCF